MWWRTFQKAGPSIFFLLSQFSTHWYANLAKSMPKLMRLNTSAICKEPYYQLQWWSPIIDALYLSKHKHVHAHTTYLRTCVLLTNLKLKKQSTHPNEYTFINMTNNITATETISDILGQPKKQQNKTYYWSHSRPLSYHMGHGHRKSHMHTHKLE